MENLISIVFRSVVVYLFVILAIRLFGKKELTQLSVVDLVFILLISNSVQSAMVGNNTTLLGGVTAALALFSVNWLFKNLFFRSERFRHFMQGTPILLIYKGRVDEDHLKKAKITREELEEAIREHGVEKIKEVDLAVLEVDGNISVLSNNFRRRTTKRRKAHKIVKRII